MYWLSNRNYKNLRCTFFLKSKVTNTNKFREKHHLYANEKYCTEGGNNNLQNISAI